MVQVERDLRARFSLAQPIQPAQRSGSTFRCGHFNGVQTLNCMIPAKPGGAAG